MDIRNLYKIKEKLQARPRYELVAAINGNIFYSDETTQPNSSKQKLGTRLYWLGALSKTVTCVAILKLVEQQKIRLDDPVEKYLPEMQQLKIQRADETVDSFYLPVTVNDLLLMLNDYRYGSWTNEMIDECANMKHPSDMISVLIKYPVIKYPCITYEYGFGHDVLSAIVERATDQAFSEFLSDHIFRPLGMTNTGFHIQSSMRKQFVPMQVYDPSSRKAKPCTEKTRYEKCSDYESGGAGIYSSAEDFLTFLSAVVCKEQSGLFLSSETASLIQKGHMQVYPQNIYHTCQSDGYQWGYFGRIHANQMISHQLSPIGTVSWSGSPGTYALLDFKNEIALFFGAQVLNYPYFFTAVHPEIENLFYI